MPRKPTAVIDEDLPRSFAFLLRELGWNVLDVRDVGLRGMSDDVIFLFAQQRHAILFTGDFGFGNPHSYPISDSNGIVLLAYPNEITTSSMAKLTKTVLQKIPKRKLFGNLTILEPGRIRTRKLQ